MDYVYTFTGGWKPEEVADEALARMEYWAAGRGDEIDPATLTHQLYENGDIVVFRAKAKLDEDGLSSSLRRARDEAIRYRALYSALVKPR